LLKKCLGLLRGVLSTLKVEEIAGCVKNVNALNVDELDGA